MPSLTLKPTHKVVAAYHDIVSYPNRMDDEQYIVRFIAQVITVSLETVKLVKDLPAI